MFTGLTAFGQAGLALEFEMAPVSGKNPSGVAVSTGQVKVTGDWQFGAYGSLHFEFNSAHYGADQGARIVTYTLPAPDGAYHKIEATYDLQFVTIKRDGVIVVRDWLDQQTTEIPSRPGPALSFNTPFRNFKVTPFAVAPVLPEVRWQGIIGNSSVPQSGNGVFSAFLPAIAMTAWRDSMFVTWGYNEGKPLVGRFNVANPQTLDLAFGFRIGAGQSADSPVDLSVVGDTLYVRLANGKVCRFNCANGALIGAERGEAIAFPASAARPVANADQTWTFNGRTIGEPGGYANGTEIKATRFGHWFIDGSKISRTAAAFQTDGQAWVSDSATCRLLRFNADGTPDGTVIHWTPHSYVMAVDKTDRTRAFNRFIEYKNGVPTRFYGHAAPGDMFGFGEGFTGVTVSGGRTLALALQRSGSSETKQLVELTATGVQSVLRNLPKESRLNKDGSVSDLNKITADGVTYSFAWGKGTGNHFTAAKNGATLWSALPTGDNTGNGTFDLRTEYPAQPGTFAVAGNYVIVACQMEFWRVGRFTGQGNQLFIFDKATGKFLRQFGLPMMMRGEVDNPPGTASNIFTVDAEENADGSVTVWANDESNRGITVWKINPPSTSSPALPTVNVVANNATVSESSGDSASFTILRAGSDLSTPLTVNYSLAGSAQNGIDHLVLGTSITIPAGVSSANLVVTPQTDAIDEDTETVLIALSTSAAYSLGSSTAATISLLDAGTTPATNPPPTTGLPDLIVTSFTISPANPRAGEQVRFSATIKNQGAATASSIGLGFFVDGGSAFSTAGNPVAWNGIATLASGQSATVTSVGGTENGFWTATVGNHQLAVFVDDLNSIVESSDANNLSILDLSVSTAPPVTNPPVVVTNPPVVVPTKPAISVSAPDAQASEPANTASLNAAPDSATFSLVRSGDLSAALTVNYQLAGSATNGVDYTALPTTATFAAGVSNVSLAVAPIHDAFSEPSKSVILTLVSTTNYTLGAASSASVTIIDNDAILTQPDLIVTSFTLSPASPKAGEAVRFTATVKNQGTAATAATIGLGFYVDRGAAFSTPGNPVAWTGSSASLAPGQSTTLTSDGGPEKGLWTALAGSHQIAVFVDDLNSIAESSDNNNITTLALSISAAAPVTNPPVVIVTNTPPGQSTINTRADLVITNVAASLLYPSEGAPLVFRAWLKNQGTAATPVTNLHLLFYLDDGQPVAWSAPVPRLQPGETRLITAAGGLNQTSRRNRNAWIAQAGLHKITAAIDIADHVLESNETNNTFSLNLVIPPATAPLVSVAGPRGFTTESTNGARRFTFTRRGSTNDNLTVQFAVGGTAKNGEDYQPIASTITIPAGLTTATILFTPLDDDSVEPLESISFVLLPSLNYKVLRPAAFLTLRDNDVDTDRDGISNRLELLHGTNPSDPLSH